MRGFANRLLLSGLLAAAVLVGSLAPQVASACFNGVDHMSQRCCCSAEDAPDKPDACCVPSSVSRRCRSTVSRQCRCGRPATTPIVPSQRRDDQHRTRSLVRDDFSHVTSDANHDASLCRIASRLCFLSAGCSARLHALICNWLL